MIATIKPGFVGESAEPILTMEDAERLFGKAWLANGMGDAIQRGLDDAARPVVVHPLPYERHTPKGEEQ